MKRARKPIIQVSRSGDTWRAAIDGVPLGRDFQTEGAVRTAIKLALMKGVAGEDDQPPA